MGLLELGQRRLGRGSSNFVVLLPDNAGEVVTGGDALTGTPHSQFLVVVIMLDEGPLLSLQFVSDRVGQLRENVSGSAALGVRLAHTITHNGRGHLV